MLKNNMRSWLETDLSRILRNIKETQKLVSSTSKIMAIVKANDYGYGDVECLRMIEQQGIDFFGVSSVDEDVRLRENGIQSPIPALGYAPPIHLHYLNKASLTQTLVSREYTEKLNAYAKEQGVIVEAHAKVDIGMSRTGIIVQGHVCYIGDIKVLYRLEYLDACSIFSHFSVSDCLDEENYVFTNHQVTLLEHVLANLRAEGIDPGTTHLQSSYGILNYPSLYYDYVRPGLLWIGAISDDALTIRMAPQFQPIMEWKANVSLVKDIQSGATISYGRHFKTEVCARVTTLAAGHADGSPRSVPNQGVCALLYSRRVPIIGNVYMNQMMADITGLGGVSEGDVATLIGCDGDKVLSVGELSRLAHIMNNETLCWISQRVPRIYKQSQQMWLFFKRRDGWLTWNEKLTTRWMLQNS